MNFFFFFLNGRTGCYHGSLKKSSSSYPKSVAAEAEDSASSHQTVVDSCTKQLNLCELCEEEPIGVKFLPCSHSILCELCATRATKCLKCKVLIGLKIHKANLTLCVICRFQLLRKKNYDQKYFVLQFYVVFFLSIFLFKQTTHKAEKNLSENHHIVELDA